MRRYLGPVLLMAASIAAAALLFVAGDTWLPEFAVSPLLLFAVASYFLATDWWILRLARAPDPANGALLRAVGVIMLGLPSLAFGVWLFVDIWIASDVAWMVLPFSVGPILFVGPLMIWALLRLFRGPATP